MAKAIMTAVMFVFFVVTPCFADFRFAVMGDTRDYSKDGINVKIMKIILERVKSEKPDFIVVTGDMITGSAKSNIHAQRLNRWKGIIEKHGIPFYIGIGNHEVESELSENILRAVFEMPENGPLGFKELAYSFDYKNCHFIMLDTSAFNNFHSVDGLQLEWLKEDLDRNSNKTIFVFGHDPAYPVHDHIGSSLDKYPERRDELWNLFKKYKISAYICSHEHLYNRSIHEGIYQIISGGSGAHISAPIDKGGFNNFLIIDVKDNGSAAITVKDKKGAVKDIDIVK